MKNSDGLCSRKVNEKSSLYKAAFKFGAGGRIRTRDPLITSQVLYQLSYTGLKKGELCGVSKKLASHFLQLSIKINHHTVFYRYIYHPYILRLQYKEAKRLLGKAYPSKESAVITANQVQLFVIF